MTGCQRRIWYQLSPLRPIVLRGFSWLTSVPPRWLDSTSDCMYLRPPSIQPGGTEERRKNFSYIAVDRTENRTERLLNAQV
jgi:hypothetical protein